MDNSNSFDIERPNHARKSPGRTPMFIMQDTRDNESGFAVAHRRSPGEYGHFDRHRISRNAKRYFKKREKNLCGRCSLPQVYPAILALHLRPCREHLDARLQACPSRGRERSRRNAQRQPLFRRHPFPAVRRLAPSIPGSRKREGGLRRLPGDQDRGDASAGDARFNPAKSCLGS